MTTKKLPKRLQQKADQQDNPNVPETEVVGAPLGPTAVFEDLPLFPEDFERALSESLGYPGIAAMKLRVPIERVLEEMKNNPKLRRFQREFQVRSLELAEINLFKKVRAGDVNALKLLITGKHRSVMQDWNQGKETGNSGTTVNVGVKIDSGFSIDRAKLIAAKHFQSGSAVGVTGPAMP